MLSRRRIGNGQEGLMSKIRIMVVDDHEVVRHGLRLSLELEPDMAVVGAARTGDEAIQVARETRPDVILLDVPAAPTIRSSGHSGSGSRPV
jgi:DNA-binding NarL/FixJ family response regulator